VGDKHEPKGDKDDDSCIDGAGPLRRLGCNARDGGRVRKGGEKN
jgi:hypothetical protein